MAYENNEKKYENNDKKMESIFSKRIRAGKRRTYFFDVRATRGNDYYLTITESRKRFDDNGYDRHKVFIYKEDFNKFIKALGETIDYVKTDLMPDFDFDAFNHDENQDDNGYNGTSENAEIENKDEVSTEKEEVSTEKLSEITEEVTPAKVSEVPVPKDSEEADKW